MQEATIKATIIIMIGLLIAGLFLINFKDCEGAYCPDFKHAIQKVEGLTK